MTAGVTLAEVGSGASGAVVEWCQLFLHVLEQLGEAEERGLDHGMEWFQTLLLGVEGVEPEEDALAEVAAVCVDGSTVSDIVGCVRVGGA